MAPQEHREIFLKTMAITDEETNRLEWASPPNKERAVYYLIIILLLMIFASTLGLIIGRNRFRTLNPDIEERKYSGCSPTVPTKDAVIETKKGYGAPCEEDWIWYQGKCYYFSKESYTWEKSQNFCISHNASLALIDTQDELIQTT